MYCTVFFFLLLFLMIIIDWNESFTVDNWWTKLSRLLLENATCVIPGSWNRFPHWSQWHQNKIINHLCWRRHSRDQNASQIRCALSPLFKFLSQLDAESVITNYVVEFFHVYRYSDSEATFGSSRGFIERHERIWQTAKAKESKQKTARGSDSEVHPFKTRSKQDTDNIFGNFLTRCYQNCSRFFGFVFAPQRQVDS